MFPKKRAWYICFSQTSNDEALQNALKESNYVMARAARKPGITERMIGYKIKKYGINGKTVEVSCAFRRS